MYSVHRFVELIFFLFLAKLGFSESGDSSEGTSKTCFKSTDHIEFSENFSPSGLTYLNKKESIFVSSDFGSIGEVNSTSFSEIDSYITSNGKLPSVFFNGMKEYSLSNFKNISLNSDAADFSDFEAIGIFEDFQNTSNCKILVGVETSPYRLLEFDCYTVNYTGFLEIPNFEAKEFNLGEYGTYHFGIESITTVAYDHDSNDVPQKQLVYIGSEQLHNFYIYELIGNTLVYYAKITLNKNDVDTITSCAYIDKKIFITSKSQKLCWYGINDLTGLITEKIDCRAITFVDIPEGFAMVKSNTGLFDYYALFADNSLEKKKLIVTLFSLTDGFLDCNNIVQQTSNWVIILVVIILVVLILFCVIFCFFIIYLFISGYYSKQKREKMVRFAPKNPNGNFSIVFTDIANSTQLMNHNQTEFQKAIKMHNKKIEFILNKYEGYCCKKIGDAFFCVFMDPISCLLFCLEVQEQFPFMDWPQAILSTKYAEPEYNSNGELLTRGLKIRIGVSYGGGEIIYDKKRNQYDYIGLAVNIGCRVESIGEPGRIIVTKDFYEKVKNFIVNNSDLRIGVQHIGKKPLKGVKDLQDLYCVHTNDRFITDIANIGYKKHAILNSVKSFLAGSVHQQIIDKLDKALSTEEDNRRKQSMSNLFFQQQKQKPGQENRMEKDPYVKQ